MLRKTPRSSPSLFKILAGGAIVVEALVFGGSYIVWRKLNTSRDSRKSIGEKYPWILNTYYWIGETADKNCSIRLLDQRAWELEKKLAIKSTESKLSHSQASLTPTPAPTLVAKTN